MIQFNIVSLKAVKPSDDIVLQLLKTVADKLVYTAHTPLSSIVSKLDELQKQQLVQSEALHIEYFAGEEYLLLKEKALWQQGENHISGNVLEYYTRTSTVKARKTEGDEDARVQAVIQPKKNKVEVKTNITIRNPKEPFSYKVNWKCHFEIQRNIRK